MLRKGIDVSKYQGKIDWAAVKAGGVQFAILRAGIGRYAKQKDPCFEDNYSGCKANGIPCGIYWYSYAMSADEARKEAAACLEVIKGKSFEYPIYFDLEEQKQFALGKAACTEIAKAFLETVENAGYWVGLYMSKSPLETHISEAVRKRYAVWVAHYTAAEKTSYSGQYGMWQYGIAGDKKHDTRKEGSVAGVKGACDLDYCYVDYPALIAAKGLNGTLPAYTTYVVQQGDTLETIARKHGTTLEKLVAANESLISAGDELKIPNE